MIKDTVAQSMENPQLKAKDFWVAIPHDDLHHVLTYPWDGEDLRGLVSITGKHTGRDLDFRILRWWF